MPDIGLSPQQLAVICALSSGATTLAAADEAGVHRNTITNWRRNLLPFQRAFADAQYDRAIYFREKIEAEVDLAIQTLHHLLLDPKTPPSVRLKAALAILNTAATPPEPKRQIELDIYKVQLAPDPELPKPAPQPATRPAPDPQPQPPLEHKPAQPEPRPTPPPPPAPEPPAAETAPPVHNPAQAPRRREAPSIARNAACPCRSGKKYKRCCMDKHTQPLAAAA